MHQNIQNGVAIFLKKMKAVLNMRLYYEKRVELLGIINRVLNFYRLLALTGLFAFGAPASAVELRKC